MLQSFLGDESVFGFTLDHPTSSLSSSVPTRKISTCFWDVLSSINELDQRAPIFDPALKHAMDSVRNNVERVVMARKNAVFSSHLANMASNSAIAKAHQQVHDMLSLNRRKRVPEWEDEVASLEMEETEKCMEAGICKPSMAILYAKESEDVCASIKSLDRDRMDRLEESQTEKKELSALIIKMREDANTTNMGKEMTDPAARAKVESIIVDLEQKLEEAKRSEATLKTEEKIFQQKYAEMECEFKEEKEKEKVKLL